MIRAAMQKVLEYSGGLSPALLSKALGKAESLYGGNQTVLALLGRVRTLGCSPALLAAMVGICGVMIGMAPHPAEAFVNAKQIAQTLDAKNLDAIIATLKANGIDTPTNDTQSKDLVGLVPAPYLKVAHCLRAIADMEAKGRLVRNNITELADNFTIVSGTQAVGAEYTTKVTLKTPDGKLLLASYSTTYHVDKDGPQEIDHLKEGIEVELNYTLAGLNDEQRIFISDYMYHYLTRQEILHIKEGSRVIRGEN